MFGLTTCALSALIPFYILLVYLAAHTTYAIGNELHTALSAMTDVVMRRDSEIVRSGLCVADTRQYRLLQCLQRLRQCFNVGGKAFIKVPTVSSTLLLLLPPGVIGEMSGVEVSICCWINSALSSAVVVGSGVTGGSISLLLVLIEADIKKMSNVNELRRNLTTHERRECLQLRQCECGGTGCWWRQWWRGLLLLLQQVSIDA